MQKTEVEKLFDKLAKKYDKIKIQVIPEYGNIQRLVLRQLQAAIKKPVNILEIGTGTGSFALKVLTSFPRARYVGIDISDGMLEVAAGELKPFKDRARLLKIDLNKKSVTGKYDIITSFFTIHHIEDKRRFFERAFELLNKDGILIFADITKSGDKKTEAAHTRSWKKFMERSQVSKKRISRIIKDHLENDIPAAVESQLEMMDEAGFIETKLLWRHGKFALFFAKK